MQYNVQVWIYTIHTIVYLSLKYRLPNILLDRSGIDAISAKSNLLQKRFFSGLKKPLKKNIYFSTADKPTADFVQFVFSTSGCRSSIATSFDHSNITYTVTITNQAFTTLASTKEKTNIARISSTDGFKYCFTVPSGMLILRIMEESILRAIQANLHF